MRALGFVSALTPTLVLASAAAAAIGVPRVDDITIDGRAEDWAALGTRVEILTPIGERFTAAQFDAQFRIGWSERGLLLLAQVRDEAAHEAADVATLWQNDCIELFVADGVGGKERVQFLIAPGVDDKYPEPRQHAFDRRSEALKAMAPVLEVARVRGEGGYSMEILVPWSVLGRTSATAGDSLALQFYANSEDPGAPRRKLVFHPRDNAHESSASMHEIVLSEGEATHIRAGLNANYDRYRRIKAEVRTVPSLVGERAVIAMRSVDLDVAPVITEIQITAGENAMGQARVYLPLPDWWDPELTVTIGGIESPAVRLVDVRRQKAEAIGQLQIAARPSVFSGSSFPAITFANPERAEDLLGEYQIETTYYNEQMQPVTSADSPGRYGAVVTIKTDDGQAHRRFRTLYRSDKEVDWWMAKVPMQITWPEELGLDPIVVAEQASALSDAYKDMVEISLEQGWGAEAFAALREMKPGEAPMSIMRDAESRDRAWWVGLKRKLYETNLRFTEPVNRPLASEQAIAPVLRPGSDVEAGFAPGTRDKLVALMEEWVKESGEPFTVCVARNGVVVLDEAYGTRDGKPMERSTPSIVFSISKAMSGTAMMMAVDQGLISLDDTPGAFLPPWKSARGRQPTIRQLFTHTAGMQGHWGDEVNDFEEIMAAQLPYLQIGQRHEYNGASLALGCKVLEQVSGESLVDFYTRHIIGPLEMADTTQTNSSWRMYTTAADLAKLGQMLLNGGAYGKLRFMSPETHQQMLPHKLEKELSPETQQDWGIGLSWMAGGKEFIGHGSASSSTFLFNPEKKLVITMARNAAGEKHSEFHKRFLELVTSSCAD